MTPGSKHRVLSALAAMVASLFIVALASGQAAPRKRRR